MPILDTQGLQAVGWHGFLDFPYLLGAAAALLLAIVLGALIAFHPTSQRSVDTMREAEMPKVYIIYALIGAMVGVVVLEYGIVVGFIVFGLGGLMRFRTDTDNTRDTGRLIVVTLLGLISGLNLPHFAVLAFIFAWVLIYIFDGHPVCSIEVKEIPKGKVRDAADAYRRVLTEQNCKVISEDKSFSKSRVDFVFRLPRNLTQEALHTALCAQVPPEIRGELDWEVE
ncbi:MAG: hypothetical protein DCF16_15950 [Alphaproteobacteria bacterium]|nr:MAG: hypothetical protein DCF16_15950 [Alphaproteobacteria bacterium]